MNTGHTQQKYSGDPTVGLNRIPYYPELKELCGGDPSGIASQVMSVMLYWHALDSHHRFNSRQHLHQVARTLRESPERVADALSYLADAGVLSVQEHVFRTESQNPARAFKKDVFYAVDFHALREALRARGLDIPLKVLRMAADDSFDALCYISPRALPVVQGLRGTISGDEYARCCLSCARIITGICADPEYEAFSYKALAPGWRMLVQPPCTAGDIAARWLDEEERSIDIDLTDGSFFLPDGGCFGTRRHRIWHCGRQEEPRMLAAALYLAAAAEETELHFVSDLRISKLSGAFRMLRRFTGLAPRLDGEYFDSLDLDDAGRRKEQDLYQEILRAP